MSALPSRRARLEAVRRAEQLSAEQEALLVAQAGAAARAVALVSVVLGEAAQSFKICRGGGEEELISFQYVAAAAGLREATPSRVDLCHAARRSGEAQWHRSSPPSDLRDVLTLLLLLPPPLPIPTKTTTSDLV